MSQDSLKKLVESLEPQALSIAETTEHAPILIALPAIVLVKGPDYRGSSSEALHAICAQLRPTEAVFVSEGWATRDDNPEWMLQAVMGGNPAEGAMGQGGVRVKDLPRENRVEVLALYAEDCEGNWRQHIWEIKERKPGGIVKQHEYAGGPDDDTQQGAMRNFVPRRTALPNSD